MKPILIEGTLYIVKDKDIEDIENADKRDCEIRIRHHNPYYTEDRNKLLDAIQKRYKPKMNIRNIYFY